MCDRSLTGATANPPRLQRRAVCYSQGSCAQVSRPRFSVDAARIALLRTQGRSVREIASELGYSRGYLLFSSQTKKIIVIVELERYSTATLRSGSL